MIRSLTVLGSTGSIGTQTLEVCRRYGIGVEALVAGSRADQLFDQICQFKPAVAVLSDEQAAASLAGRVRSVGLRTEVLGGSRAVCDVARDTTADMVMCAMVGMAGLAPAVAALEGGHEIALANKEVLVTGGQWVMRLAAERGRMIRPVDSEHSAIWQCLMTGRRAELRKIWLTASGGPFRGRRAEELANVTVADALRHPTWSMGAKITIDSATLMNKGLELIEACHLFDVSPSDVEIMVHPQSVIHSMVEWQDGSVVAQMGHPDMKLPIQLALGWPDRWPAPERRFNPFAPGAAVLTAEPPDEETFRCLRMAREAMAAGGAAPAVLNGANEAAAAAFLAGRIRFSDIPRVIEAALDQIGRIPGTGGLTESMDAGEAVRAIVAIDAETRRIARGWMKRHIR